MQYKTNGQIVIDSVEDAIRSDAIRSRRWTKKYNLYIFTIFETVRISYVKNPYDLLNVSIYALFPFILIPSLYFFPDKL
jgi:hypothetical protein